MQFYTSFVNLALQVDINFSKMYYKLKEKLMIKIAIDGFSGSGKGELSKGLAKKLNLKHLDTGAIFRGIACAFVKMGITEPTETVVNENIDKINIKVTFDGNSQNTILDDENINHLLREEKTSQTASKVSVFMAVREKYLAIVREFSNNYDCVIDGRDITSIVLPDADLKIFLNASEETRAKRRYEENVQKNIACTYQEVLENLKERDYRDSHRDIAPLIIVEDAFVVDNSNMGIEETIDYCYNEAVKILKQKGKI